MRIQVCATAGKTDFDFYPKELAEKYRADDRQVINSGMTKTVEEKYLRKGREIWIRTTKIPLLDVTGKIAGIVGSFEEIKEYEQTQEALIRSEKYFRALIENAVDIILIVDREGTITYASPSVERIIGYKPQEMVGKSAFDFICPDDLHRAYVDFAQAILTSEINISNSFRIRHKDGSERILEGIGKNLLDNKAIAGFIMNVHDVTERDLVEKKLKQSEEYFRALIENAMDLILHLDQAGIIIYASPSVERFIGYKQEEMVGKNVFTFVHPGDIQRAYDEFGEAFLTSEVRIFKNYRILHKSGSVRIFEGLGKNLIENNAVAGFIMNIHDFTDEKRLEEQLRQAHRTEAIGTLASGIAHDFNNILTPILLGTEMVQLTIPEDSPLQNDLQTIIQAAHRARELVQQILTFSRQGEEERQPLKLVPLVKETLKLIRSSLPSTIEIKQRIVAVSDIVTATPAEIYQIIMNLCTNAAQSMKENSGLLEIELSNITLPSTDLIAVKDLKTGDYIHLSVRDNGHGMDKWTLEKIFNPFFTTKERKNGTGMGLSVVHGIIESLQGKITVESEVQQGTTFNVYLPCAPNEISPNTKTQETAPRGSERILFIDDETAITKIYKNMLELLGYNVAIEHNAIAALSLLQKEPERFDLVITDQTMPMMTGIELAKKLLSLRPDLPIILCTGFSQETSAVEAGQIGIREVLFKPVGRVALAQAIRHLLDRKDRSGKEIILAKIHTYKDIKE